jgi:phage-related protein (TIGR01555 family)
VGKKNRKRNRATKAEAIAPGKTIRKPMKISQEALSTHQDNIMTRRQIVESYRPAFTLGKPKEEQDKLAMDACAGSNSIYDYIGNTTSAFGMFGSAEFIGYAALSNLMQDGLLRIGADTMADEMTRKWIQFDFAGEDDQKGKDKNPILEDIESEFTRLKVRERFNTAEFYNEYFGGCLVYIDTGDGDDPKELLTPLALDKAKIKKGCVVNLQPVEPVNVYPGIYNSNNPLLEDYFEPSTWFVLGKEVHKTRLLFFAANTPPILLKPAYNFFGIPPVQMILDYVANFTDSREAAARLLQKFSLTYLKTNMSAILTGGSCEQMDLRAQLIAKFRDNNSLIMINGGNADEAEGIEQVNTPLSGVIDIVRQTLEFVAALWRIPVVKFLGISPGGMNATGESDFQNFYDHILSVQEKRFRHNIQIMLEIVQLNLGKEPDPNITFKFVPLKEMSAKETAEIQKLNSEKDVAYIDSGVISQEEVRQRIVDDPDSGYNSIDVDDVPEAPDDYSPEAPAEEGE